ncbi:hypothetical protein MPL3365_170058 [Mesorhizobium plurifarium]|uniref:Uncharacterized protein n=1 Tax=Mesorhizobium plurifarium TaxID=69974 RepID=A0A090FYQ5_MESPL|nr:hypothetical protein MPL3365_170058 [Mesorhizobium plurifarium]
MLQCGTLSLFVNRSVGGLDDDQLATYGAPKPGRALDNGKFYGRARPECWNSPLSTPS